MPIRLLERVSGHYRGKKELSGHRERDIQGRLLPVLSHLFLFSSPALESLPPANSIRKENRALRELGMKAEPLPETVNVPDSCPG